MHKVFIKRQSVIKEKEEKKYHKPRLIFFQIQTIFTSKYVYFNTRNICHQFLKYFMLK